MATIAEMRAQAADLLAKADEAEAAERTKALEGVMKKLGDAGLTLDDLIKHARPAKKKGVATGTKLPVKFRSKDGAHEWSGRGHHPDWLKAAMKGGAKMADFAVK